MYLAGGPRLAFRTPPAPSPFLHASISLLLSLHSHPTHPRSNSPVSARPSLLTVQFPAPTPRRASTYKPAPLSPLASSPGLLPWGCIETAGLVRNPTEHSRRGRGGDPGSVTHHPPRPASRPLGVSLTRLEDAPHQSNGCYFGQTSWREAGDVIPVSQKKTGPGRSPRHIYLTP